MIDKSQEAVRAYARLLLKYHEIDPRGELESAALDNVCDQMDVPWAGMNGAEQERMNGLSEDLYALADGRVGIDMTDDEKLTWLNTRTEPRADGYDLMLSLLRKPFPNDVPPGLVPLVQAKCWEGLGDLDVALVFAMEASGKGLLPGSLHALGYSIRLGRTATAIAIAEGIIDKYTDDSYASAFAANALYLLANQLEEDAGKAIYERIIPVLRRVLAADREKSRKSGKAPSEVEALATRPLAFALIELGKHRQAADVCTEVIGRFHDPILVLTRAIARMNYDVAAAASDFEHAAKANVTHSLPYVFLAWYSGQEERYGEVLRYGGEAIRRADMPARISAFIHEWRGVASAMIGQSREWIDEEFRQALSLDHDGAERIEHNRRIATRIIEERARGRHPSLDWSSIFSMPGERDVRRPVRPQVIITHKIPDRAISGRYARLLDWVA